MNPIPKKYVVWDLETTGFDPATCKIVEVAAMKVQDDGTVLESFSSILNYGVDIDPRVSAIHGITRDRCDREGLDPKTTITRLLQMIDEADGHVTHNGVRFDIPFLERSARDLEILLPGDHEKFFESLTHKTIDTAALYKAKKLRLSKEKHETMWNFFLRVMNIRAYGLKYNVGICCDELGIDRSKITQHRAGGDILLTNEIYRRLVL